MAEENAPSGNRRITIKLPPEYESMQINDRAALLDNVIQALLQRFQQQPGMAELEAMVAVRQQALDLFPLGHPGRPERLSNLANTLSFYFSHTRVTEKLEESIHRYRESLDLLPPNDPARSAGLNDLASVIFDRFSSNNSREDLDEAIMLSRESLALRQEGHPDRGTSTFTLGMSLRHLYFQTKNIEDLEESIIHNREAVALQPPGHPQHPQSLVNLAHGIYHRFKSTGSLQDLGEAIKFFSQVLDLCPPAHPMRAAPLVLIAVALSDRFDRTKVMGDLEEAIACNRECLSYRPPGHPNRADVLYKLGNMLSTRFEHMGGMDDLEEAIAYHRENVALHGPRDLQRAIALTGLGKHLAIRVGMLDRMEDIAEAIAISKEALLIFPTEHPARKIAITHIAICLHRRYGVTERLEDLKESIANHQEALALCSPEDQAYPRLLHNLASCFSTTVLRAGDMESMEEAVDYYRKVIVMTPPMDITIVEAKRGLAELLARRGKTRKSVEDLEEAIKLLSDAGAALQPIHPLHTQLKSLTAHTYVKKFDIDSDYTNLSTSFIFFEKAVEHPTASVDLRFGIAVAWVLRARNAKDPSAIRAYSALLALHSRLLAVSPTFEAQQKYLASSAVAPPGVKDLTTNLDVPPVLLLKSLGSDAASCAIQLGQLETAVEFLEQGRAFLWSKMRGYRQPLEALREADRVLADRFERLSGELEQQAMVSESVKLVGDESVPLEVRTPNGPGLSEQWDEVVERIREISGFQTFLKAVPFSTLREAAAEGPVILVNISVHRSDAIIIQNVEPVITTVRLWDALPADLIKIASKFSDPRGSSATGFSKKLAPILRKLWEIVVEPVVKQLGVLGVKERSRIWWCPTAELCGLPIHAAGPYLPKQKNLPDLYISSYITTLSALLTARSGASRTPTIPKLLVIAQPGETLPAVEEELHRIRQLGSFVDSMVGEEADRESVISRITDYAWAHFACHGHRHIQPLLSSFELHHDQRLVLLDLIKARAPKAEHAFLSACHGAANSTIGDTPGTPDEVIHLAAALLFCGFRSVVGTLWAMADEDGPDVSQDFYQYMFRDLNAVDFRDSATALNLATREMRKRKGMTLGRWVNFVHFGA